MTGEQQRVMADGPGVRVRPGGPDRPPSAPGAAAGWRAGARSELRRQLREVERWRRATLVVLVLLVLGAYPSYLLLQAATRDQVLNSLDTLDLPGWAAEQPADRVFGSRWCIEECRFRERQLTSQRSTDETAAVYHRVLSGAGWVRWEVERCPELPVTGSYTCWKRDEYTLDLWVRDPPCAADPLRNRPTVGPVDPSAPPAGSSADAEKCSGSIVTIKVRNGIADDRGRGGESPPPPENPDFPDLLPSTGASATTRPG